MRNWIIPDFQRSLTKQPAEEGVLKCDFSERLIPYFGQLVSAEFSAEKWDIEDPDTKTDGSDIFAAGTSGTIDAPYLTHANIEIAEGDAGYDYKITCLAETATGEKLERDFIVRVREQ